MRLLRLRLGFKIETYKSYKGFKSIKYLIEVLELNQ